MNIEEGFIFIKSLYQDESEKCMKHIKRYLRASFSPGSVAASIKDDGQFAVYVYLGLAAHGILAVCFLAEILAPFKELFAAHYGLAGLALVLIPVLNIFLTAAVIHGFLMVIFFKQLSFRNTLLAVSLGASPMITLSLIGLAGWAMDVSFLVNLWSIVVAIWSAVIQVRMLVHLCQVKPGRPVVAVALTWVLFVAGSLAIRFNVIESFKAPSQSMVPTIHVNDHFFIKKYITPKIMASAGNVVVFEKPTNPLDNPQNSFAGVSFVKRIIGIGGDRVEIVDSQLFINGKPVPRCYVGQWSYNSTDTVSGKVVEQKSAFWLEKLGTRVYGILEDFEQDSFDEFTVPKNHVFVMGDHRDRSSDSRFFGAVPHKNLIGPATRVWWQFSETDADKSSLNRLGVNLQGPPIPQPVQQKQFKKCLDELL